MKAYVTIKNTSKAIMYFSALMVLVALSVFALNSTRTSADDPFPGGQVVVNVKPEFNAIPSLVNLHLDTADYDLPIKISVTQLDAANPAEVDHISVFVTEKNLTYNPSSKAQICSLVGSGTDINPSTPLESYIKQSYKQGDSWTPVIWEKPSSIGDHQIFAVAMKDSSGTCKPENIAGWSKISTDAVVSIYRGTVESGSVFDLSAPDTAAVGETISVTIRSNRTDVTRPIDHISVLVQDPTYPTHIYPTASNICSLVGGQLRPFNRVTCSPPDATGTQICNGEVNLTLSAPGAHRIVGVAMSSSGSTACALENVISVSAEKIVRDPTTAATTPADGTGDGTGAATPPAITGQVTLPIIYNPLINPLEIRGTNSLIKKIEWFIFTFISILAFSAILYAAFIFMTAGSNEQMVKRAKGAMTYGVTAIVLVYLAYAIVNHSVNTINELNLVGVGKDTNYPSITDPDPKTTTTTTPATTPSSTTP